MLKGGKSYEQVFVHLVALDPSFSGPWPV